MPLTLLYHAVLDLPGMDDPDLRILAVAPADLEWQLAELADRGLRTLTLDELYAAAVAGNEPEDAVALTFDDAYAHVVETVTPLLERHGFTAVLFVPVANIGATNDWDTPPLPVTGLPVASAEKLRAAARGPWELASHGYRHVDLRSLTRDAVVRELAIAREKLSVVAGREIFDLAYPFGLHDENARAAARAWRDVRT